MSIKHYTFWGVLALAPVAAWTMLHGEAPDPGAALLLEPTAAGSDAAGDASSPFQAPSSTANAGSAVGGLQDAGPEGASLAQWQALLAAELMQDPSKAWRHALQLAAQRPAWAEALIQPLLEPLWQRREFELMMKGLDDAPLPGSLRDAWANATVTRWAEFAPAQAAAWAASAAASKTAASGVGSATTGPGASPADLLAMVNDRWAHQDPRSATVFASTLTTAAGQALLTESLSRWLALDGPAARAWIRAQGASLTLDTAIAAHATQDELARQAPQEAIELVHRIADPLRRNQAQWALARTLHDIDAAREDLMQQALQGAGNDPDGDANRRNAGNDQETGAGHLQ